jgi:hypothetical protein
VRWKIFHRKFSRTENLPQYFSRKFSVSWNHHLIFLSSPSFLWPWAWKIFHLTSLIVVQWARDWRASSWNFRSRTDAVLIMCLVAARIFLSLYCNMTAKTHLNRLKLKMSHYTPRSRLGGEEV